MLKPFSNDPESQSLNPRHGFITICAIAHDTGQRRHFGQPTAVLLTFELDGEGHVCLMYTRECQSLNHSSPSAPPLRATSQSSRTTARRCFTTWGRSPHLRWSR